jgi:hypothetical protein
VTLSATLTRAAISGRTVTFNIDNVVVAAGTTSSSGVATVAYTIPTTMTVGPHTIRAKYNGSAVDASTTGSGMLTVN